jgi:phosphoglycolate phosphatase-like HAD superfamily hydrolase
MKNKKDEYYAFDLDGTLAYSESGNAYHDLTVIGEPIPNMIAIIKEYINAGKTVKIFTARAEMREENPGVIAAIENWCEKHIGMKLPISNVKDSGLKELWDDRAVAVQRNTGLNIRFTSSGTSVYVPLQGN